MHTACPPSPPSASYETAVQPRQMNVWSKKLPFAGYSVVKDHSGGNIAPRKLTDAAERFPPDPLGSLHSLRQQASLRSARPNLKEPDRASNARRYPASWGFQGPPASQR